MRKFIAIGDIHADFGAMWAALRAASCLDAQGLPTPPVRAGLYQVVLIGDLIHPKNELEYARHAGVPSFDFDNSDHLFLAARAQVQQLEKLKAYQDAAPHAVHIVLGNHDSAVLNGDYILGTAGGIKHIEFDPAHGGTFLPGHMRAWFCTFLRELRVGHVQFAHVGPLPQYTYYDDLFYADPATKRWWRETPDLVGMAGLEFGVYGHTQMQDGVLLHESGQFAMIDALHSREYLEIILDPVREHGQVVSARPVPF
ncbi:metallophosphoesterase [Deinococcus maricopensis]|uniref:Metallophosphoesterase n=1 Tax=Deinococcus maricopensis (strain DSM 21211 / LMG 22137 / NRRL B-23946 / LB-34) TaxID=709986 RepID=E8U6M0_DEIML|nr:metallophosphoesterase [Deinococcus maricopensis]ADV66709.1 metallophosphoesterase [Deinococcus maricopensis DSM 21211]